MKIEKLKINDLNPAEYNPRTITDDALKGLENSIKTFGVVELPVVNIRNNTIVSGHQRYKALKNQGVSEVECIIVDLDPVQEKALNIAMNNKHIAGDWDTKQLDIILQELAVDFPEFDDINLDGLVDEFEFNLEPEEENDNDPDEIPEEPETVVVKLGDLIELGNHRLLCGDSTKKEDVERLMNGEKADMVFTDPPYNIDYQGVSDKRDKIKNDKMSDDDFTVFLVKSLMSCETMYVCCSWQYAHLFKKAMEAIARKPKAMIIWDKINPAQHLDKYFKQHEIIFYYGDFGGQKTLRGDVWQLKRQQNTVHPTMKPVELIEIAINDQPDKKLIQDSFLGSGSTLIACEKTNRKCYGMELDEKYCQVIIQRWCDYTERDQIKINGHDVNWSEYKK